MRLTPQFPEMKNDLSIGYIAYRSLDRLRKLMIVAFFIFIIVSCFLDVGLRYAPWFRSLGWTEEILRYLNVWIILLGASVAVQRNAHLTLRYFLRFFPTKIQIIISRFVILTTLFFLAIMIFFGAQKAIHNIPQQVQSFPISIAWFYLAIPLGSFYMFVDFLLILVYGNHPFFSPNEEE